MASEPSGVPRNPHRAEARPVVVMKFGGTSVATREGRRALAGRVSEALELGLAPVVVVSAMGRAGDSYATDTLLALVEGLPTDKRERDLLATTGELIACVVVAHELRADGIDAMALSGAEAGIVTDGVQGDAAIVSVGPARLFEAISSGHVPVVAGFQGVAADGRLTALGRGGSDTTACALGVALGAEGVEIHTDVDGVMSADPRTCDSAVVLERVSAEELFSMAEAGSKVVHSDAAEIALGAGIPLKVKNTFGRHGGTAIADVAVYHPSGVATAVSRADGVARFEVSLGAPEGSRPHMAAQSRVYSAMAEADVSLDMFTPAGNILLFTVPSTAVETARALLDALPLEYRVCEHLSKVTLVGAGMHGVPGVMARVTRYLLEGNVPVLQTADSHTTISVLVAEQDAAAAVQALHDGFELGRSRPEAKRD